VVGWGKVVPDPTACALLGLHNTHGLRIHYLTRLIGTLGLALGGSILFFALSLIINQAQLTNFNIVLLASHMSSFAFVGFLLIGLGLYLILKSATQRPKQSSKLVR
jgi:hypothetical protein